MHISSSDIFLLHSDFDKDVALQLENVLMDYGISVSREQNLFLENRDLQIEEILEVAKFVVVLWSSRSVESPLIKNLASEAKRKNILIQALIASVEAPKEFRGIKTANLVGWGGDRDNEQVVKLWKVITQKLFASENNSRITINPLLAIAAVIVVAILTIASNKSARCYIHLESCSDSQTTTR